MTKIKKYKVHWNRILFTALIPMVLVFLVYFGFILRYPKGKEYITGYSYEPWHYRYVGVEVATYIYENDITFEEYYAYFIENN